MSRSSVVHLKNIPRKAKAFLKSLESFRNVHTAVCGHILGNTGSKLPPSLCSLHGSKPRTISSNKNSQEKHEQKLHLNSTIKLNNGVQMPRIGLGVYKSSPGSETRQAVHWALQNQYHMIDTAARYANEHDIGEIMKLEKIDRNSVFIVTKVWDDMHGYMETTASLKSSIKLLGIQSVDLYLIHSPVGGKIVETWRAMIDLMEQGYTRSIGVSNFDIHHLVALSKYSKVTPAVNQIEVHPFHQEAAVVHYCKENNIAVMAYSPLTRGIKLTHPVVKYLAYKHRKTPANVLIRWCLQKDLICIPKSVKEKHIRENIDVFDFHLDDYDMRCLDLLEENFRTGTNRMKEVFVPY